MSAFRNIIARRRPPVANATPVTEDTEAAPGGPDDAETEAWLAPPATVLEASEAIRPPSHPRPQSRPLRAEEAPRWDVEPPRPTMGEAFLKRNAPEKEAEPSEDAPFEPATPPPGGPRIWDLDTMPVNSPEDMAVAPSTLAAAPATTERHVPAAETDAADPVAGAAPAAPATTQPPAPSAGRAQSRRVKTRLLGFHAADIVPDVFATERHAGSTQMVHCPVGFLVIVDGPGYGTAFSLSSGLSTLGRGEDQTIVLDFGDVSISRDNHASIAYDDEDNRVLIGHGGKSNLVRLNGSPLVSAAALSDGDTIRIGKTTLRFVALCGPDFSWSDAERDAGQDV